MRPQFNNEEKSLFMVKVGVAAIFGIIRGILFSCRIFIWLNFWSSMFCIRAMKMRYAIMKSKLINSVLDILWFVPHVLWTQTTDLRIYFSFLIYSVMLAQNVWNLMLLKCTEKIYSSITCLVLNYIRIWASHVASHASNLNPGSVDSTPGGRRLYFFHSNIW